MACYTRFGQEVMCSFFLVDVDEESGCASENKAVVRRKLQRSAYGTMSFIVDSGGREASGKFNPFNGVPWSFDNVLSMGSDFAI
jgi:hypothetical protein